MKVYKYNPDFSMITKRKPEKALVKGLGRRAGRNNQGRITVRHQGGGHKRLFRMIDFHQNKTNIPATISSIEYDPNRTAFIALLKYADGEKRYVLAGEKMKIGEKVITADNASLAPGNRVSLSKISVGSFVYNVELIPGKGGQLGRSAGVSVQVMAQENNYTHLLLPSGEVRMIRNNALATIGQISNADHFNLTIAKAGRSRWQGRRPTVRGTAMNPVDHPHGGGEGRTGTGLVRQKTPWGKPAKGVKTRHKNKRSNKYIVRRRRK